MAKSQLYFLGHVVDLIMVETVYSKDFCKKKGIPVFYNKGGLLKFIFDFESNFLFLERMTTVDYDLYKRGYPIDEGKIVFYKADGDQLKVWRFKDAPVVYYQFKFDVNGDGIKVEMIISPAIQDYGCKIHRSWRVSSIEEEAYQPVVYSNEQEKKKGLKFIAKFERLNTYGGEFGFDWMRDNYKEICENYEKLKKEYYPTSIHDEEYFVPTLSMFPNQKNVKLKLTIKKKEGTITDADIVKLPERNGIRFEPNLIKVSEANNKEIKVFCDAPLNSDLRINLLDKNDEIVGVLNVFKNANYKQLHFNITPVRILRGVSQQNDKNIIENIIDHPQGFGDKNKDINGDLQNLQKYLNTQSLNQALLQCTIGKVYDVIIDEGKWLADDLIVDEGCAFKGSLLGKFEDEFKKQHPVAFKNRGITIFMSPLQNVGSDGTGGAGGYGNLGDIDSKNLAIFKTNLHSKDSFAHEIAHVAGLEHSFKEDNMYNDPVVLDKHNIHVKQVDDYIDYMLLNNVPEEEIAEFWNSRKEGYKVVRSLLNVYYRNLFKFKQGNTDNFMDYYTTRKSFWKFQWKALQDDVLKFYKL